MAGEDESIESMIKIYQNLIHDVTHRYLFFASIVFDNYQILWAWLNMVFNCLVAFVFKKLIVSLGIFSFGHWEPKSLGRRWQEQEAKWVWRLGFSQHRVVQPLDAAGEKGRKKKNTFCRSVCHHISQIRVVSNIIIP